ncbi:NUDIX domain-containing protein [Patescibacteria group bacterium]|nr:NUDIX domain-containing protein [Patescibacteria group bacterium]MBU1029541.1 NUDIX domain-containing protein [Patescibacteria group bacterium]MBU1916400.1 NUDIX domain-containing protein [Patescibacteria group bacterium]
MNNIKGGSLRKSRQARPNSKQPKSGKPAEKLASKAIKNKTRVEISAGGIVFRRTPKGVRVALLLDPFGKWAFAKGHVEPGETIQQAAVRETMEEMGLNNLQVRARLGKIDFWFHDQYRSATRGMLVHKHVHLFLLEAPAGQRGKPQKKEKIRRIIWVSTGRLKSTSSYADVKPIIDRAVKILDRYKSNTSEPKKSG